MFFDTVNLIFHKLKIEKNKIELFKSYMIYSIEIFTFASHFMSQIQILKQKYYEYIKRP